MKDKEKVGAEATTKNTGTTKATETKKSYEELSQRDKKLQSFVDKRVTDALKTAKVKWQEELEVEKTEAKKLAQILYQLQKEESEKNKALAELEAYKLKEKAIKIAGEKGLEVSLLNVIDFNTITAEKLNEDIDNLSTIFKKAVEKVVNEKLKKDTPITTTSGNVSN